MRLGVAGAAVVGPVAAAAAIGAGELAAAFTGPPSEPAIAVGAAAVDLTPTDLREFAITSFGTNDKPVLLAGIYLVILVLAVLTGLLAVVRPYLGAAAFVAFGGLGAWAAASRADASASAVAPSLLAGAVGATVLLWLVERFRDVVDEAPGARRQFLFATGGTVAGAALAGFGGHALAAARTDITAARRAVVLPPATLSAPPVPASAHPPVAGLAPFRTPNAAFYRVDTALTLPAIDPKHWSLRIHGMVDRPLTLSFEDLLRRPLEELDHTLSCVSNPIGGPYVGTTRWLGASLPALLREAGVRAGADQLVGRSREGMTIGTPLASVLDGRRALVAIGMSGEPLPVAHGFPARTVVPGFYGYTSATKWLVELELTTFAAFDAYWIRRGWGREGVVKTASRIEVPASSARVHAGTVTVAGSAWATHRGIAAVEVRLDGGPWAEAVLGTDAGPDLWRQWSHQWTDARPGSHTLQVRATDGTGTVQPEARTTPFPDGATGWHTVTVKVV